EGGSHARPRVRRARIPRRAAGRWQPAAGRSRGEDGPLDRGPEEQGGQMNPRHAALSVSIACCMVLVAGVLAQPSKGQAPPTPPATGSASTLLESRVAEVRSLTQDLEALVAQMRALLANRPRPPAAKATDDEKKRYQQALDQWNAQLRQLEQAMDA